MVQVYNVYIAADYRSTKTKNMKKSFIRLGFVLVLMLCLFQVRAQKNLDIVPSSAFGTSTPLNPVSVCQCDTLGVSANPSNNVVKPELRYRINITPFGPTTKFYYELATPSNTWGSADSLELISLTGPSDITPVDTFGLGVKEAHLVIPCNTPIGSATLRIRNSNGQISDTAYVFVNPFPNKPKLDSIRFGFPNPYTVGLDDWGFCPGDSVILYAENQPGASYTWLNNGVIIPLQTGDSLVVKESGSYRVRVDFGACARDSRDTIINISAVPTTIVNTTLPPAAIQIDNPNINGLPRDSVRFCQGSGASLQANAPVASTGLTFRYQWITDSIDQFGDTTFYSTGIGDTLRTFFADTTARFYVVINDGLCSDTSQPYYAFMDTLPSTQVASENFKNGLIGPQVIVTDICMTDSTILSSTNTDPGWTYQWQRLNTATNTWSNLTAADIPNPNYDGTQAMLQVDTSIKPIQPLSFYRLRTRTVTSFTGATVCEFFSAQVRVRWFPDYTLDYAPQPWVASVGNDSVSLCETDSVQLIAPTTPGQLVTNGLNYTYQWLTDDTATVGQKMAITGATNRTFYTNETGRYYVALDDGICIDTSAAFSVFVDTVPATTIFDTLPGIVTDRLLCLTDSVILLARSATVPFLKYQWQQYNSTSGMWANLANDTLPGLLVDTALQQTGEDTAYFRLQVSYTNQFNLAGCPFTTDSLEVIFFNPPNVSLFPGDSLGLCAGDSLLVIAQGNSFSYSWAPTGELTPSITIKTPGTYFVTGTGVNGCQTTRRLVVYPITTVANAGPDVTTTSGTDVVLSGSGGTGFRWYANKPIAWSDFLSQNVTVSYTLPDGVKSDTITIYLEVTNSAGCLDLDSLTLIVTTNEDAGKALLDQAWNYFSPGSGGLNNTWDITSITSDYATCRIDIMNRWGSIIFNEEDFNGVWDGRNNGGQELPDGTYYYILSCDGEIILKNAITLIRKQ